MAKTTVAITKAAEAIANAKGIFITAGAGMGVDSGLPDFRGNEGFWKAYPPYKKFGYSFIDMANPEWFVNNIKMAWGFYGHRLNLYRNTVPHKGFDILKNWIKNKKENYFIFTSNVDGQFQKAGFDSQKITECHGSIHYLQCLHPCSYQIWENNYETVKINSSTMQIESEIPQCKSCSSPARPNILMFGDYYWMPDISANQARLLQNWLNKQEPNTLVVIECGAGTEVPTVRLRSESVAHAFKGTLIRINPREPEVPIGHIGIKENALNGLEQINQALSKIIG